MRRKFSSPAKAAKAGRVLGIKYRKGPACKLSDGRKGNWYTPVKGKRKKRK